MEDVFIIKLGEIVKGIKPCSKVLHLTLKKKYFDMILSGEKKEEYRENKRCWNSRFIQGIMPVTFNKFDYVHFYNGGSYSLKYPNFIIECKGISIGKPKKEWYF